MKLTVLIIIIMLGLLIPIFWLSGTLASALYFCLRWVGALRKGYGIAFHPQLGPTMADGGDSIDNKEKKERS